MSEQLKPCPFCGMNRVTLFNEQVAEDCMMSWVECGGCGARSMEYESPMGDETPVMLWNRRKPDAALVAALKEAAWLYDQLALSPLEAAVKYGDTYEPPSDEDCLRIRGQIHEALLAAGEPL